MNRRISAHGPRRPDSASALARARTPGQRRAFRLLMVLGLAGLAGASLPDRAEAQVSRCVDREGHSVFTDRPCEALDSASRVPRAGRGGARGSAYRGACARSLPVLIRDLTSAIDSGDANRLGMLYLWDGVSDADALRIFNRLQSIVDRTLVDIVPLRREVTAAALPAPGPAPAADIAQQAPRPPAPASATVAGAMRWAGSAAGEPSTARAQAAAAGDHAAAGRAPPQTRSVVTGLRLQQTAGNRATPVAVVLGLRRAYDCWWISLPGA